MTSDPLLSALATQTATSTQPGRAERTDSERVTEAGLATTSAEFVLHAADCTSLASSCSTSQKQEPGQPHASCSSAVLLTGRRGPILIE